MTAERQKACSGLADPSQCFRGRVLESKRWTLLPDLQRSVNSACGLAASSLTALWPSFPFHSADSGPRKPSFLSRSSVRDRQQKQTQQSSPCPPREAAGGQKARGKGRPMEAPVHGSICVTGQGGDGRADVRRAEGKTTREHPEDTMRS